jgi:deoxyribodipyrimidine photo-lyase
MAHSTAVVWFRRDLRLHDHPALTWAVEHHDRVIPLFVVDDVLVGGGVSANRLWFMAHSVDALARSLAERGAILAVRRGQAAREVIRFARQMRAQTIVASRDYGPYGRQRDAEVQARARRHGIGFVRLPGVLVHEPEQVHRVAGGHFAVFGPFRRAWQALPQRAILGSPAQIPGDHRAAPSQPTIHDVLGSVVPTAQPALIPEPGEPAARRRLADWAMSGVLDDYDEGRDRLDLAGTSRLSQDLRWGLLSPIEVLVQTAGDDRGRQRFDAQLCWRDFYAHLLWHRPTMPHRALRPELEHIARETDSGLIDAWREGRTGHPVIDAAMRQLLESGWMHNRARMIAASFLTKQLGVDWRVGAAHFMRHLVDGDLASNSGGWQWAASTGTDAQPYFRVFNPAIQARRHDPQGDYVRRWVSELDGRGGSYPAPIVEHPAARRDALAAYRRAQRRAQEEAPAS